jgi:hypothetical protein
VGGSRGRTRHFVILSLRRIPTSSQASGKRPDSRRVESVQNNRMKNDRVIEIVLGIIICRALLTISAVVAIPILSSGIGSLPTYFHAECDSSLYLLLFVVLGFIACFDVPERIRRSDYLRGQAFLLASTAFVIYVTLRFLVNLPRIGAFTGSAVIGIIVLLGLTSVVRVMRTIPPAMRDHGE